MLGTAIRAESAQQGVSQVNENVNVMQFFQDGHASDAFVRLDAHGPNQQFVDGHQLIGHRVHGGHDIREDACIADLQ